MNILPQRGVISVVSRRVILFGVNRCGITYPFHSIMRRFYQSIRRVACVALRSHGFT